MSSSGVGFVAKFADDYLASYEHDEDLIIKDRPNVLDGGSTFRDEGNVLHTDACGWIAIHAALHLLHYQGQLPKKFADRLVRGELTPAKLKKISNTTKPDVRICRDDFHTIGLKLDLQFVIHEPGMPSLRDQRFGKKRNAFQVHLYFALAHYMVNLKKFDQKILDDFLAEYGYLGYRVYNLADQCTTASDHQLALRIANENTENDRQLALRIADEHAEATRNLMAELELISLIDKQIEQEDQIARDHAFARQLAAEMN